MTWRLGCILACAALLSTWGVGAKQVSPTPESVSRPQEATATTVVVGPYQFEVDAAEPFQAHAVARTTNLDGSFVTWYPTAQLAAGTVVGLTPCDDVAVICAPIISPAKAAFTLADPGDSFSLAKETAS